MIIKAFRLKVIKIASVCNFELSWGEGLTISAKLDYPHSLDNSYAEWRQAYLNCYENLRGKIVKKGKVKPPSQDWQGRLGEAEARFLSEFHRWLRNEQLYEIRQKIENAARNVPKEANGWVDVLLCCDSPELARLPWEAWEINTQLSAPGSRAIRLARVPKHIRDSTVSHIRRKARVLAILGDDKGINLKEDKQALRAFSKVAEVEFIGWEPGKDIAQLKQEIVEKIGDREGIADSLNNLGVAYRSLGDYRKAINYHQQSLVIDKQIGNREGIAASLNNLGGAYYSLGDYHKAIDYHQQSLVINKEIENPSGIARSLNNLGNVYDSLGDCCEAIDYHQQAFTIFVVG